MQEAEAAVFEEPNSEDGKSEEKDKDEKISAVLPVAFFSLLLGHDCVLHVLHLLL